MLLVIIYYQTQQHWNYETKNINMLQPKNKYFILHSKYIFKPTLIYFS